MLFYKWIFNYPQTADAIIPASIKPKADERDLSARLNVRLKAV
jgi:hypothetical protein